MKINPKYKESILRYLNKEMNTDERHVFEKELDENSELMDEFMRFTTYVYENEKIIRKIDAGREKRIFIKPNILYPAAAVILILITIGIYFKYLKKDINPNDRIAGAYLDYPSLYGSRTTGKNLSIDSLKLMAHTFYYDKKYDSASVMFLQMIDKGYNDDVTYLYAGLSLLKTETERGTDESIYYFKKVLKNTNISNEPARWFLAVALFNNGQKQRAKKYFEQIASSDSNYRYKGAIEILETKY
ncbi:MAG: hypothetical protein B6D61_06355 [Bacteroidetes bacterium 4484_249]|nr:MAG: hypothetical protein B6D61_06355 [Bacteroidetes bacterium 4484_249]